MIEKQNFLTKRREPFKFMMQLGIFGSILLFGLIFGVYFLRKTTTPIPLPTIFHFSTALIILSSFTLGFANVYFKKESFVMYRIMITSTFLIGILFIILQLFGWNTLLVQNYLLNNNMGAAFLYILSGLHIAHILIGILVLYTTFKDSMKNKKYLDAFIYSVNSPNILRLKLISYYWHFVGLLWFIIYLFLLTHQ